MDECESEECSLGCYENATDGGKLSYQAMAGCISENCPGIEDPLEYYNCAKDHCKQLMADCGFKFPGPANTSYSAPYGNLNVDIRIDYIMAPGEAFDYDNTDQYTDGYFATGTLAGGSFAPSAAEEDESIYLAVLHTGTDGAQYISVSQRFFAYGAELPEVLVADIDIPVSASNGTLKIGLGKDDVMFRVLEVQSWSTGSPKCIHAFGYGDLTLSDFSASTGSNGKIRITGSLPLYSPANFEPLGGDVAPILEDYPGTCPVL